MHNGWLNKTTQMVERIGNPKRDSFLHEERMS